MDAQQWMRGNLHYGTKLLEKTQLFVVITITEHAGTQHAGTQ